MSIGVLEQIRATKWAALTFIVPKKDGHVCWVSDFHTLNSMLRWKYYLLPPIQDILFVAWTNAKCTSMMLAHLATIGNHIKGAWTKFSNISKPMVSK
jgi:hypothetical protein